MRRMPVPHGSDLTLDQNFWNAFVPLINHVVLLVRIVLAGRARPSLEKTINDVDAGNVHLET